MEGYCRFIVFRDAILLSVSKEYAYVACLIVVFFWALFASLYEKYK